MEVGIKRKTTINIKWNLKWRIPDFVIANTRNKKKFRIKITNPKIILGKAFDANGW